VTPSPALAAVIGDKPMPRTEVTKKVWEYIKKNDLQDKVKRTMINADAKLKAVVEAAQISMFEMTKKISKHLK
jgi:chromatin remodeling complex protein RSC6